MTLNYVSFIKNQKESPFYKLNEMIEIDTNIQYIGKRVKIADDSEYKYQAYRDNGNGEGEIIYCDIYDEDFQYIAGDHIFTVRWDNGHENGYRTKDLTLIENIEETNIKKIRWYKSGKFVADVIDQPEKSTPI